MRIADLLPIVINLCRFRGGPQDIPYRPSLLLGLLIASIALDLVSAELLGVSEAALGRSLFSTGLLLSLCWLALRICGFASRYVQTASALVACSIVFSLLIVPLALLFGDAPAEQSTVSPAQALVAWLQNSSSVLATRGAKPRKAQTRCSVSIGWSRSKAGA